MAVVAITGVMGAGKTYFAVKEKLIPFLRERRPVVTSIAIADSCFPVIANYLGMPEAELRTLLIVLDNNQLIEHIKNKTLFYHPENCPDAVIMPGCVFMPDEAWAIAKKGRNTYDLAFEEHVKMHRHYKDSFGRTCEYVLITQSLRQMNSDLTDLVELEVRCKKQKALGKPNQFIAAYHEGGSRSASHFYTYTYDKTIFPLYKSHEGGGAEAVEHYDKSMSIFNRPIFKFLKFGLLPVFVLACFLGYGAFSKLVSGKSTRGGREVAAAEASSPLAAAPVTPGAALPPGASRPAPVGAAGTWRIVASYSLGSIPVYQLVDEKGRYRTVTPGSVTRGAGDDVTISADAESAAAITPFSNSHATYTSLANASAPVK